MRVLYLIEEGPDFRRAQAVLPACTKEDDERAAGLELRPLLEEETCSRIRLLLVEKLAELAQRAGRIPPQERVADLQPVLVGIPGLSGLRLLLAQQLVGRIPPPELVRTEEPIHTRAAELLSAVYEQENDRRCTASILLTLHQQKDLWCPPDVPGQPPKRRHSAGTAQRRRRRRRARGGRG